MVVLSLYGKQRRIRKIRTSSMNLGHHLARWRKKGGLHKYKKDRNETKRQIKQNFKTSSFVRPALVMMNLIALGSILLAAAIRGAQAARYLNPILPGFHPDPSCIYVDELDQTFFCATSSFSVFPGIPIHASKDLTNWKLASNVLNRPSQLPEFASTPTGQDGIFAPTLRYHSGTFYLITTWVSITSFQDFKMDNIVFTSTDPFNSSSWSDPTHFDFIGYDPSLFWDVDGTAYLTGAQATSTGTAIALAPFDPLTGQYLGPTTYPYAFVYPTPCPGPFHLSSH